MWHGEKGGKKGATLHRKKEMDEGNWQARRRITLNVHTYKEGGRKEGRERRRTNERKRIGKQGEDLVNVA